MSLLTTTLLAFILLLSIASSSEAFFNKKSRDDFLITEKLPGLKEMPDFKMYSGHMQISESKRIFFYLMKAPESQNPDKTLVSWNSGGPGCASGAAYMIENGPFTLSSDGEELTLSKWRWNQYFDVLFVESPVGVGFSYSLDPKDYQTYNDNLTSTDFYHFMTEFMHTFDEYKDSDYFIAAESYGGHYSITQARKLDEEIQKGTCKINLKGIMVGNGCSDNFNDGNSVPLFMAQHGLISLSQYEIGYKACKGNFFKNSDLPECQKMLNKYYAVTENINPYAIYSKCEGLSQSSNGGRRMLVPNMRSKNMHPLFSLAHSLVQTGPTNAGAPCIDATGMEKYFNRADVRRAFNVDSAAHRWEFCSMHINSIYDWTWDSMVPFVQKLSPKYRILYYSGDVDMAVNTIGNEASMYDLNQTIAEEWRQWHLPGSQQVAGMIQRFEHVHFATVRGAGHLCPNIETGRPEETFYLVNQFVKNEPVN